MLNSALIVNRVPLAKRQEDLLANTAILNELVKQTELAIVTLHKETPLIQVIDRPILPLLKKHFGKVKVIILCSVLIMFITVLSLILIMLFTKY